MQQSHISPPKACATSTDTPVHPKITGGPCGVDGITTKSKRNTRFLGARAALRQCSPWDPPDFKGTPGAGSPGWPQTDLPLPLLPTVLRLKELSGCLGQRGPGYGREGTAGTGTLSGPTEPGQTKASHSLPGPTSRHQPESTGTTRGIFAGF